MGSQQWPRHPGQDAFRTLEAVADSRSLDPAADPPNATYEVVLHNVMASVPLLEILGGELVRERSLGIDHLGRICRMIPGNEDYSGMFRDVVEKLKWKLGRELALQASRTAITEKIMRFIKGTTADNLP
ncbi:hypothetical protein B0I37DRAFT_361649 [Chaetomium sp. MPI-CAGE-AT-0009]|nr:hypothetical protein B0I37DRAFT_361649 [Chaetomium sp. MPI-CAGE-AT-0009]